MQTTIPRKLPVGIQTFSKIREEGYIYVDKTDIVWNLANGANQYNYLSRPRRFGKSLLVTTLQAYFEGRRELFEGLKIMGLETEWIARPVIRLDMSKAGETLASLKSYLNQAFGEYERKFGSPIVEGDTFQTRLHNIISTAHKASGLKVAVLIDEYDFPLQHSWGTPEHDKCAATYREVFTILKADDEHIRFVFITGVTKFTQISLFSALNNLVNISLDAEVECICGISQQELEGNFQPEIEAMAEENEWTKDETIRNLKDHYDGYHFSKKCRTDIYNPFCLIQAFRSRDLRNYWASSGSNTLITKFVKDAEIRLREFDGCRVDASVFENSDITSGGSEIFLYQSGYLTIKGYRNGVYTLGFPNAEVRQTLYETVLPILAMRVENNTQNAQGVLKTDLMDGILPEAMDALKALISDVPYSNKKLESMDMEERYRLIISTILNAIGLNVEVERMLSTGRIDMVAKSSNFTYVIELKLQKNGGLKAAASQIRDNHYLEPFRGTGSRVIGIAIELDDMGKGMTGWQEVKGD